MFPAPRIPELMVNLNRTDEVVVNGVSIPGYALEYVFICDNGELTSRHFLCNGMTDCHDGSDERSCDHVRSKSV